MKSIFANIIRLIFKTNLFKKHFFGFYKRIIKPFNLFAAVEKNLTFRNNIRMQLDLDDWVAQNIYFLNAYEEKELRFIEKNLLEGDVFIDIGANIGLFSLVASKKVGQTGKVYAFEPFERNYKFLQKHIVLNNCNNIAAEQLAVGDKEGVLELRLNENEKNYGMVSAYTSAYTTSQKAPIVSLDAHLQNKLTHLKLVKIDIEGGEYPALKGMEKTLMLYKPMLLLEINPENYFDPNSNAQHPEDFLLRAGYRKYYLDNSGELQTSKMTGDDSNNYVFKY